MVTHTEITTRILPLKAQKWMPLRYRPCETNAAGNFSLRNLLMDIGGYYAAAGVAERVDVRAYCPDLPLAISGEIREVAVLVDTFFRRALSAVNEGGAVHLRVKLLSEEKIELSISDNSAGMTRAELSQFARTMAKGCRYYQEAMIFRKLESDFRISSDPNAGTMVAFTLPRA